MTESISRFPVVELDELPDDLRERVGAIAERSGFVPEIFRALGHVGRRSCGRSSTTTRRARLERESPLSKAERELVIVATSGANHCTYCVVAHGAILRIRSKEPELADHVGINPYGAELDPRRRAIVDLALSLALESASLSEDDLDDARDAGLSDEEIGTSGRSPPCSRCPTVSRTSPRCAPTPSSSAWAASRGGRRPP